MAEAVSLFIQPAETEAVVVLPPAWRVEGARDAVYCAAVTGAGEWIKLDPTLVNLVEAGGPLLRWSRIGFRWHEDAKGRRTIDPASLRLVGEMPPDERYDFLSKLEVRDLAGDATRSHGLALLRPQRPHFSVERKSEEEMTGELQAYDRLIAEQDGEPIRLDKPRAFRFKYRYSTDASDREEWCEGSEINAVFSKLSQSLGDAAALAWVIKTFGKEYPEKGVVFALAADESDPAHWRINGVICMDEVIRASGQQFNIVA